MLSLLCTAPFDYAKQCCDGFACFALHNNTATALPAMFSSALQR
jgi:hypothetical protein